VSFSDLIIGGIRLPRHASLTVDQDYSPIGAASMLRMGNGGGIIQSSEWGKWSTTISCTGWSPSGLDGINWKDPGGVVIACIKPMSLITTDTENVITIPGTYRTDAEVIGYALVGNYQVPTAVSMEGNVATLTAVSGATAYKVEWLPILNCFCNGGIKPSYSSRSNEYAWSLEGEEL
jgi:hypothetical protein